MDFVTPKSCGNLFAQSEVEPSILHIIKVPDSSRLKCSVVTLTVKTGSTYQHSYQERPAPCRPL